MGVSQSLIGRKFGRWKVIESAPKHIGNYDNLNSAIKARIEAEKKYFGEFARHQEVAI